MKTVDLQGFQLINTNWEETVAKIKTFEKFDFVSLKDDVKEALKQHKGLGEVTQYEVVEVRKIGLVLIRDIDHCELLCSPDELIKIQG